MIARIDYRSVKHYDAVRFLLAPALGWWGAGTCIPVEGGSRRCESEYDISQKHYDTSTRGLNDDTYRTVSALCDVHDERS